MFSDLLPTMGRALFFFLILCITGIGPLLAQGSRDRAVEISASVQESPPQITLAWNSTSFPLSEQKLYRRIKEDAAWTQIATPANAATSFTDASVSIGVSYEYWIYRVFPDLPSTACGYIRAGIRAPLVADRGKLILLVDATMAAPLAAELTQWQRNLAGDGWTVIRQNVSRTATPPSVRAIIQGLYAADPAATKALILFGHIPVAYSGDFAADGHLEHYGAWPADVYYADVDGIWTDTTIDDDGALYANQNVPGDGKFDQSVLPSDVELQTGRIDLSNLPAFSSSETELLRQYLNRNHAYRFKLNNYSNIPRRALVDDNFGFFYGDAFATDAWRAFTPICGPGNVIEADWFGTLQTQSYLWAYGCGGGGSNFAGGIGTTADFATKNSRAVFNLFFGSWFGDWNVENNFLRAPLAGKAGSLGLASCFASRPRWVFHPMALGETIGYCTRLSSTGTRLTWSSTDEELSAPLPLGFGFPFYGNTHHSVRVFTNGFLTFTGKIAYGANSILPNLSASENMIAAFWNDIVVDSYSGIYYQNIGGNFVVQFENLPLYGNGNTRVTCQAILKPTGEISLQYKALTQTGNNYTIGIQNSMRNDGLLIAYNAPYVHPGLAVRISPPGAMSWLTLSATSGMIAPVALQAVPLTLNATGLPLGDYFAEIIVDSNAPGELPAVIPVRLTVGNTPIENWRQTYFQTTSGSGNAADSFNPDSDGRVNLLEYAFVSNPLVSDSAAPLPTVIDAAGYLQVQFTRHAGRTDLRYIVEATTDLAGPWTPLASSVHGAPTLAAAAYSVTEVGAGEVKTVTVQDSSLATTFPRRFVRLSIVRD